jgi:hypothetical protein
MIEIELFDGTVLQFPEGTSQEVIDRVAREETMARQQDAEPAVEQAEQPVVTHTTADGGRIFRMPDGSRAYAGPAYSTTDPAQIDRLMEGATPADLMRTSISEQILEERPIAARAATALQGVPFVGSFTDEAIGMVSPEAGANVRRAVEAVREERPGQAMALEVGGAVAALPALVAGTPAAAARFVAGAQSLGGQVARTGALGALGGALEGLMSGFGRGEDTEGRMRGAGDGAAIGGLAGGVVGAALPAAGAAVRSMFENIKGRSVGEIARTLGISTSAARVVRTALENDDLSAAQAALQRAGSTSMLADAGPATQQLLDVSITAGGAAPRIGREAVEGRAADAGARMTTVLDDILGAPEGTGALQRGIRQDTAQARNTTYRAAYAQPIDYSSGRGRFLERLMTRVPQSAINRANELMRLEGVQGQQIMAQIAEDGSVTFQRMPGVRELDYITRALGDVADTQNAAGGVLGGTTQLGRATQGLQRQIREVLRREVPEYGVALDTAADAISRVRAVDLGASILSPSTTREAVREGLRGASAAERSAARAGFRSALDDRLARVNAVASDPNIEIREFQQMANNLRSRAMRDNMEALLGPRDAERLYRELDQNVVSLELRAAIARNSATARRQAISGQVEQITDPGALGALLSGRPVNAVQRIVQTVTGTSPEARTLRQMGIYDEIATALTGLRGQQAEQALRLVERAMAGDALTETQARVIARALTTPAALAAYATATSELEPEQ